MESNLKDIAIARTLVIAKSAECERAPVEAKSALVELSDLHLAMVGGGGGVSVID